MLLVFVISSFNSINVVAQNDAINSISQEKGVNLTGHNSAFRVRTPQLFSNNAAIFSVTNDSATTIGTTVGQVTTGTTLGEIRDVAGNDLGSTSSTTTVTNCPMMFVDVNVPFLQSCVKTNATVSYCNHGTAAAPNSYVDVTFDAVLALDSASLPYTLVSANVYRFQLGTILANNCGSVEVYFTTACDSALIDDQHCIRAHVYPDTLCASVWNNYLVNVDAVCLGSDIEFSILNKGIPIAIASQIRFIIIEDHLLVQGGGSGTILYQGFLSMPSNTKQTYSVLGLTNNNYKIEIRDANNALMASSTVQNCSPTNIGTVSNYHVLQFWNGSNIPSEDIGCATNGYSAVQSNVGANQYDSNIGGGTNTENSDNSASNLEVFNDNNILVEVFPNPFIDYTTVRLNGSIPNNYSYRLYDLTGRILDVKHFGKEQEFTIYRNKLLSGIYIYQIESDGKLIGAGKIVVQ